jgi:flagellar protein FliS
MWKDAYLESRVLSADPLELVHILYGHTLEMVRDARRYLASGDIAARGTAISRAIAAVAELDASLDHQAGGSVSRNLASLYEYMRLRLLTANIQRQDAPLAEVESLLRTLDEAWSAIRPGATEAVVAAGAGNVWRGQFAPDPGNVWRGQFAPDPGTEFAGPGWSV